MYEFFPWTWIMHLLRVLVTYNIVFVVLEDKYNKAITFFSLLIPSMIYSYVTLQIHLKKAEFLSMFLYYILQFAICLVVTKGKLFSKLFCPIFSLITWMAGSLIFEFLRTFNSGVNMKLALSYKMSLVDFFIAALMIYALSFITVGFIKYFQSKTKKGFSYNSKLNYLFLFPITHILFAYSNFSILSMLSDEQKSNFYKNHPIGEASMVIISLLCIMIDFIILFLADHIEKVEEKNIKSQQELLKNKLDYQQMMMIKEEKQKLRKIKHDYTNILSTAKGFIEIGKPEKALSILKDANDDLTGIVGFSLCSNETINTVIYMKTIQAKNKGVILKTDILEEYSVLTNDYDLCRILGNIIDNSINAVCMLEENKECKIIIEINRDQIIIKSTNRFKQEEKLSSKRIDHGNGLGIIREIAEKYNGNFVTKKTDNVWTSEVYLQNIKNANSYPPPPNFRLIVLSSYSIVFFYIRDLSNEIPPA